VKNSGFGLIVLTAFFLASNVVAAPEEIEHKIPPGYRPEEARDEQGIWMELLEYETMLQKSPLLVKDVQLNIYSIVPTFDSISYAIPDSMHR
jgi:hypothetical protein